jgi:DNA-binding CsgD family transcriptional regulator
MTCSPSSFSVHEPPLRVSESELGVLILSLGHALVYVNAHAHRLIEDLTNPDQEDGLSAHFSLPAPLVQLCHDLTAHLGLPSHPPRWPNLQLQRCLVGKTLSIVARGLGLSDVADPLQSKLMVTLEAVPTLPAARVSSFPQTVLTSREQSVVDGMAAGLTNKEIGARLNVSEGTVKEYVKRIRMKVGPTSRGTVRTHIKQRHLNGRIHFSTDASSLENPTSFSP